MKKNRLSIIAMALVATMMLGACGSSSSSSETAAPAESSTADAAVEAEVSYEGAELVVATWGWTAAQVKELSAAFEAEYGCEVFIDETAGNADRLNKVMAQQNNPEIDVVLMSESFSVIGNNEGLFEKIDTEVVTNLDHLYDFAQNAEGYGPAYSVVRYGVLYNADMVEAPTSYMDLFNGSYDGLVSIPDMTSTAGPMLMLTMAEALGGGDAGIDAAFDVFVENKDNIVQYYSASSDVQTAFTSEEIAVSVFMDMNVPSLRDSGFDIQWADVEEGAFSAAATINVVKDAPNPELAQLYVNYILSDEIQNQVADVLSEAPTNMNAGMSEDKQEYLAYGEEAFEALVTFDSIYIDENKADWIDRFQREVTVQ